MPDIARECSPFLDSLINRHPDWFDELSGQGRLEQQSPPAEGTLDALISGSGIDTGLRIFRNREMMRIVWRELNHVASLDDTMGDLSRLAELCLQAATSFHSESMQSRFGTPRGHQGSPQQLVVISMGKLGGGELNLSSDIDIVFTFPESGHCDGSRKLSNEQFFTRLARSIVKSLSEVTEDGFCFRVDTRLRPFGESGPLVCSFGAMEQYYQREGRDWERYALVKARPVAGDLDAGTELLSRLSPFVYRRYIDFGAVEALHEMYGSLREDSARHDRADDIKRGPGGIREIEFLVQTFQLLRGGRERALQTTSLLTALAAIEQLSILPQQVTRSLRENYQFLRRLENAIQALHDQQTHSLPAGEDLGRVARVMGFDQAGALLSQLEDTRNSVITSIEDSFPQQPVAAEDGASQQSWNALKTGGSLSESLHRASLETFMASLARHKLSRRAAQRLDQFMPGLLKQLEKRNFAADVLADVLNLVLAICRRSAYLSLLVQNPPALKRMLSLFGESDWIASTVIRHPALLDELIDPALGKLLPDRSEMDQTARRILDSSSDTESALQALNHMKLAFSLRIAVAELETTLSARQVQHSLTSLAETIIQTCYLLATSDVESRHGTLDGDGIGIIGYGSLGAAELGYGSDLDLIFLYRHTSPASSGKRPLEAERYHTAVVRRLLSFLTSSTTSGRLYEVDTRLRPNGRSGLLVSSLKAFEKYQKQDAWTWEMQALSRARPCAGSPEIGSEFSRLRMEILARPRNPAHTRDQVIKMRQRLREAHPVGDPFKHGEGGLIDIDFVAQSGVLELGATDPAVLEANGTLEQLQALLDAGWLQQGPFETLYRTQELLTRTRHWALLARKTDAPDDSTAACADICRSMLE
jgi:glutamate-ammonia-ligase adenylyltransferase